MRNANYFIINITFFVLRGGLPDSALPFVPDFPNLGKFI